MIWVVEILDLGGAVDTTTIWSAQELVRLERLCAVLSEDPAAAPDLAQETLLQAWRIRERLTDLSGGSAWLDAVARNVCRRWRVETARRHAHEQPSETWPDGVVPDEVGDLLDRQEVAELLERALGFLPADTRAVMVGRYVEERSPSELASLLGATPDAVSMRLLRGRTRLRELLDTELSEEPVADAWRSRREAAWSRTRLTCPDCGRATVSIRRDERRDGGRGVVELRCTTCTPDGVASSYRLDNPTFGDRVREARRPSTVVGRMAAWNHDFWTRAMQGPVPCTRCGAAVRATTYLRPDPGDPRGTHGWAATCATCGEELSTSLAGLLLARPEVRALRRTRPRTTALPSRLLPVTGRPAIVVAFRDAASGEGVEGVFDEATCRLLTVTTTR